ncbi:MAG: exodeoxyribonuclease III [Bowdeniella nasicola]|nr:exodeoxyribonuclease III [Bowdeniella nasicola]
MLSLCTINVNGIRAAARRGLPDWLTEAAPDVLLLQEVRATPAQMDATFETTDTIHLADCRIKGRAGVAVITALPHSRVQVGLSKDEPDVDTGRWLEVDLQVPELDVPLTVISAYLHSGTVGTEKMDQKYAHLDRVNIRLAELAEQARAGDREVVMAGDFNIVRSEQDIKNWKGNYNKTAGVLQDEINYLDHWFDELGYVDVHRSLNPGVQGPYTWWSWRGKAFDNDAGWRIDYQMATPGFARLAREATVGRASSYDARFSDHAPLTIRYDMAAS